MSLCNSRFIIKYILISNHFRLKQSGHYSLIDLIGYMMLRFNKLLHHSFNIPSILIHSSGIIQCPKAFIIL